MLNEVFLCVSPLTTGIRIFCIVPPYVLDEIADKGTPQQRAAALRTKAVDNTFQPCGHPSRSGSRPNGMPREIL